MDGSSTRRAINILAKASYFTELILFSINYQLVNAPSSRRRSGGQPVGFTRLFSASSSSKSTPKPGILGAYAKPSSHLICFGNKSFAKLPGRRGISCTPTLVDAIQRATQAAAATGPSGLWGAISIYWVSHQCVIFKASVKPPPMQRSMRA